MAGVGEAQPAGRGVEHAVQAGDEHVLGDVRAQVLVHALEHLARVAEPLGGGAQHRAGRGHHERRRHALVGDVADHDPDPAVVERDEVVEVAADLARRPVVRVDLPARQVRQRARQEVLLDQLRDLQLLLQALAAADLDLLLAHELADAHGRGGLGGEALEQPAIVARVVLVREPRAEVQEADQLALGHQRHDQLDTGAPQLAQRGRVELESLDVDRARERSGSRR